MIRKLKKEKAFYVWILLCSSYVAISADVNVEIKSKSVWDSTNRNELVETDLVSGYLVGLHNIPTRLLKMDKNVLIYCKVMKLESTCYTKTLSNFLSWKKLTHKKAKKFCKLKFVGDEIAKCHMAFFISLKILSFKNCSFAKLPSFFWVSVSNRK